ncbi:MAG: hypothetical protein ACPG80_05945 [Rickettsiales bacterium]
MVKYVNAKQVAAVAALALLTACSGTKSTKVAELTKQDKYMDCTTLQLEMTEAEFLRDRAERNRGLSISNVMMPLGYASTYMSSSEAVEAASGRIEYLSRLYEIKGCANQHYAAATPAYGAPEGAMAAPAGVMYQPMSYAAPQQGAMPARPQPYSY